MLLLYGFFFFINGFIVNHIPNQILYNISSVMKSIIGLLLFLSLSSTVSCVLGVDVSDLFSTSTYQCFKSNGYSFAIVRAWHSYGGLDTHANQGLTNAKSAGLTTDIYMFPCRGKTATSQVDAMIEGVTSSLYGRVWIDVETNPSSGCSWSGHDSASNCQFLTDVVNRVKSKGKAVGIYASASMWQTIFGSRSACPGVGSA